MLRCYQSDDVNWNSFKAAVLIGWAVLAIPISSVFILSQSDSSAATSCTASEYVTVPERNSQIEETTSRNEHRARNTRRFAPKMHINEMQYDPMFIGACGYEFFVQLLFNLMSFIIIFQLWKLLWSSCLYYYLLQWRGKRHFDVLFWRILPVHFCQKMEKRGLWGEEWMKGCLFPARVGIFPFHS